MVDTRARSERIGTKTALVTGGAARLGRRIVLALADHGFDVAIHYRHSVDQAQECVRQVEGLGRRALAIGADLHSEVAAQSLIPSVTGRFGPIDLLVNNASIFETDPSGFFDLDCWRTHIDIHGRAAAQLTAGIAAQERPAHIVNMIDQRVFNARPGYFSYSASKAVLWTITKLAAIELAPDIRVNAIAPGMTLEPDGGESFEAQARQQTLTRAATDPEDIIRALLFLEETRSITGQTIILDGGQHLGWRTVF